MSKHNRRVNFFCQKFHQLKAYKSRLQELVPSGITMQYWAIYQYDRHACAVWHHYARPADLYFALSIA